MKYFVSLTIRSVSIAFIQSSAAFFKSSGDTSFSLMKLRLSLPHSFSILSASPAGYGSVTSSV